MNDKFKKVASAAATAGMLLYLAGPVLATEIVITGNGAGSDNYATVTQVTTTVVTQNNVANVTNDVDADADTGGNDASFNTGGDVVISTGNASADIDISNTLNSNMAEVDCCDANGTDVEISGNGAYSDNTVGLLQESTTVLNQNNVANVINRVKYVNVDTGDNSAGQNTGGGVVIVTGNAKADVSISTTANTNTAMIGDGLGGLLTPSARFVILNNGAGSDNYIAATLVKTTALNQSNVANIRNDVDADADTGDNSADFNTDGAVAIVTGNAEVMVDIDNMVNFNYADIDCGCTWDVLAKIAGNGAEQQQKHGWWDWWWNKPDNVIELSLISTQVIGANNIANLDNDARKIDVESGNNTVVFNGGQGDGDPSVVTGNASSSVDIENTGNVNTFGSPLSWPWGSVVPVLDFSGLLAFFGVFIS